MRREHCVSIHALSPTLVSYHGGHTLFDGKGTPEDFVRAAIDKGFRALGFSEHMPAPEKYPYPDFPAPAEARRLFDGYVEEVTRLKAEYARELPILLGIETEYLPDEEHYVADFVRSYPFDYVVGSVHHVAGTGIDYIPEDYNALAERLGGLDALAIEYYRMVRGLLELGITDVLGHLDLIDIFAPERPVADELAQAEDETLAAAKRWDVVLDVNARGLIKPCAHIYPCARLLRKACVAGIPVTLGDDSHAPEQVGARLHEALSHIQAAGYTHLTALFPKKQGLARRELPLWTTSSD